MGYGNRLLGVVTVVWGSIRAGWPHLSHPCKPSGSAPLQSPCVAGMNAIFEGVPSHLSVNQFKQ